jgi:hypothetical protein
VVAAALGLLVLGALALQPGAATERHDARDADARVFKFGSDEEAAMASLLQQQDAPQQLAALLRNARSDEARLYALCGMRQVSRSFAHANVKGIPWDSDTVNMARAGGIAKATVAHEVKRILRDGCTSA